MVGYQITIDCQDCDVMARFWAAALGYALAEPPGGFATWKAYWLSVGVPEDEADDGYDRIVDPAGVQPAIWFQQVPEPLTVKNRLHFDLLVGGGRSVPIDERRARVLAEVDRLVTLGAGVSSKHDSPAEDHFFVQMTDPEGYIFDVV